MPKIGDIPNMDYGVYAAYFLMLLFQLHWGRIFIMKMMPILQIGAEEHFPSTGFVNTVVKFLFCYSDPPAPIQEEDRLPQESCAKCDTHKKVLESKRVACIVFAMIILFVLPVFLEIIDFILDGWYILTETSKKSYLHVPNLVYLIMVLFLFTGLIRFYMGLRIIWRYYYLKYFFKSF